MDHGLVNAFLVKEDLNENEQMVKQNLLALNDMVQRLSQERASAAENFQRKEQELLKFTGALENQLVMVSEMSRRMGLEPLHPPQEQGDVEEDTE